MNACVVSGRDGWKGWFPNQRHTQNARDGLQHEAVSQRPDLLRLGKVRVEDEEREHLRCTPVLVVRLW